MINTNSKQNKDSKYLLGHYQIFSRVYNETLLIINLNAEFQRIVGDIRKPSSVISAKNWRKTIDWERLEIQSENQRY